MYRALLGKPLRRQWLTNSFSNDDAEPERRIDEHDDAASPARESRSLRAKSRPHQMSATTP